MKSNILSAGLIAFSVSAFFAGSAQAVPYTFTTIDYAGATSTIASGINNAGQIVGNAAVPAGTVAPNASYIGWELNGGVFTPIMYPGAFKTCGGTSVEAAANGINSGGVVAGQYSVGCSTPRYGFTDTAGSYASFSVAPGISTTNNGLNDSGVLVGSSYLHTGGRTYSGFINNGGVITILDAPGVGITFANGINNAGTVVGAADSHGFIYSAGVFTSVNAPGAVTTTLTDINNSGVISGYLQTAGGAYQGFTLTGGVFDIITNPLGVNGTWVTGLNDIGQVVGYYTDASNVAHGFVGSSTSVPAPGALALLGLGLFGIGGLRRKTLSA